MADGEPRPVRTVLRRNQGRWTAVLLVLGVALAAFWLLGRGGGPVYFARFATFNTSLSRGEAGALVAALRGGDDGQARKVAAIVQRVRPDVLLLQEFDHDREGEALRLFVEEYLAVPQPGGGAALEYPHRFAAPVNTGEPSGFDLDGDGSVGGPGDAFGFGRFPGQYGMALLSRYPISASRVRTFRMLPWSAVPGGRMPGDGYGPEAREAVRLSSKSHWDVPVRLSEDLVVHVLASHPTPPVFDGEEDRNGRRNADEIRLWADYVTPGAGEWIRDDRGRAGGLPEGASFVVMGDLNADPFDGEAVPGAIARLLDHPRIRSRPVPASAGARSAAFEQWGANSTHEGPHAHDTADFADDPEAGEPGNLRVDYVLPSTDLDVLDQGVFWPTPDDPLLHASDHRLVWIDLRV